MSLPNDEPLALFVHLGGPPPKHLILNIRRFQKLFPDIPKAIVLTNGYAIEKSLDIEVKHVGYDEFPELEAMSMAQNFEFRNGFWRNTFLRIFAIKIFQEGYPLRPVLHIESDVLLMPNFPWQDFKKIEKLAWMRVHEGADIAALLYSPKFESIQKLTEELIQYANTDPLITDMSGLYRFAVENEDSHTYLPSLTPLSAKSSKFDNFMIGNSPYFNSGYFDPLGIGIWYFGQDPKNSYGTIKRYVKQNHHDLIPDFLNLKMDKNGWLSDDTGLNVFSLHIHSKNLDLFGENWIRIMQKQVLEAHLRSNPNIFLFGKFLESLQDRPLVSHIWIALSRLGMFQRIKTKKWGKLILNFVKRVLKIK